MRKILITGANGMLAKAVREKFKENQLICTDVEELDITNLEQVEEFVEKEKPEYIINCAAFTAVDKAEECYDLAEKINAQGPKNLALAAEKVDATLVHISTDYVFDGDLDITKSYTEQDKTAPVTVYGITKRHGEEAVEQNCKKYYIFRTAWLYGDGNNFIRTMLKLGKEKEEVSVVNDQHGSPTYSVDLANIIYQAMEKKIPYGIYHATNQGFTTWYELTKKIYELESLSCRVKPVTSEEFVRPAKRPKNSMLSKEKLLAQGVQIPNWEDAVQRYLKEENARVK